MRKAGHARVALEFESSGEQGPSEYPRREINEFFATYSSGNTWFKDGIRNRFFKV